MLYFSDDPDVTLLRALARGALKQNLARALRLWVWLRVLYGVPDEAILETQGITVPSDPFTFASWRALFFSSSHPTGETAPPLHDSTCACAKTTHDWLLLLVPDLDDVAWQRSLQCDDIQPNQIDVVLKQRLFGVTRRSLSDDLHVLASLGWVQRHDRHYRRVTTFPDYPTEKMRAGPLQPLLHPDLVAIAHTLAQPINGYQRFFLHVEYVVPKEATDRVDDWQAQLRQIWEQTPIPPIQLTFYSAKQDTQLTRVVYPVCVYYAQRGPYLCAWGELPEPSSDTSPNLLDWRNYRLDRIYNIRVLSWEQASLPSLMHDAYRHNRLPIPNIIQERMADAWGFDFYQPADVLLLRFDANFAKRYIDNSLRHDTFVSVSYAEAMALVRSRVSEAAIQQQLLQILQRRSADDAYYTATYRRHDLNILLRLRAWRPYMEVLLPWTLRQQIAAEVLEESRLYSDDIVD